MTCDLFFDFDKTTVKNIDNLYRGEAMHQIHVHRFAVQPDCLAPHPGARACLFWARQGWSVLQANLAPRRATGMGWGWGWACQPVRLLRMEMKHCDAVALVGAVHLK